MAYCPICESPVNMVGGWCLIMFNKRGIVLPRTASIHRSKKVLNLDFDPSLCANASCFWERFSSNAWIMTSQTSQNNSFIMFHLQSLGGFDLLVSKGPLDPLAILSLWFYLCSTCSFHQFPLTKLRTSPDLRDLHLAHVWKRSTEAHFASKRPGSIEAVTLRQSPWRITNCDHMGHEMSPLNITQPLAICSIMATIRWCPIFPKWDSYQPLMKSKNFCSCHQINPWMKWCPIYCPHSSSEDPRPVPFGQKWTNSDNNQPTHRTDTHTHI